MSETSSYQHRTRMFARMMGPYSTVLAIVAMARTADMSQLLSDFTSSRVWPWVTGAFILAGGVAIVAFHQVWRGTAAIIVSVLGWLLVVRGILLMAFPRLFAAVADRIIGETAAWVAAFVVMTVIGLYLTFVGWRPMSMKPRQSEAHVDTRSRRVA